MKRVGSSLVTLTFLIGCAHSSVVEHERHPCDPYGQDRDVPVAAERARTASCGDGRLGDYDVTCTERCSGGCGMPDTCTVDCVHQTEPCDGAALGGASCGDQGYAAGALACAPDCSAYDTARCDACADASCRELILPAPAAAAGDHALHFVGHGAGRRAYFSWIAEGELFAAPLDAELRELGTPLLLGGVAERWPSAPTSRSLLSVVGTDAGRVVSVLDADGARSEPLALPEDGGGVRLFEAAAEDGAIVTQGEMGSNEVRAVLLDARGRARAWPTRAVVGVHPVERVVVVPITPGDHTLRLGTQSLDVHAARGDRVLVVVHASACEVSRAFCVASAALLHDGVAFPAIADALPEEGPLSVEAGTSYLELTAERVAVDGQERWHASPSPAPSPAFAPIAAALTQRAGGVAYACFGAAVDRPVRCVLAP